MLFYLKKLVILELLVALLLGGAGWFGMQALELPIVIQFNARAVMWALISAAVITFWTLGVQRGYALIKGHAFAGELTKSLARHFAHASPIQVVAAAFAAAGEEMFFRGLIQGQWGLLAGAFAFMVAHIGGRDIRVIGYWSVFQGAWLGVAYALTGNLLVPMLAHGLFDLGAMVHFRRLMRGSTFSAQEIS